MKKKLIAIICMILIISMPIIFSASSNDYFSQEFGGSAYNDQFADSYKKQSSGYSYGQPIYLGESIIVNVADYEPKQVRESLLDQSNVPVFFYLKGTTLGTLFSSAVSPFAEDPEARDPLTGITNIPKIEYIDITMNSSSYNNDFILGAPRYIPPRSDRYSLNNLGALILYLKRLEPNAKLPADNTIKVNMNAKIYFNMEDSNLLGLSRQDLTLKEIKNEEEFVNEKELYSIFSGKGYVRAVSIDDRGALIQVYNRDMNPLGILSSLNQYPTPRESAGLENRGTVRLVKGGQPQIFSFGYTGNPLLDTFQLRLEDIAVPKDRAEIEFSSNGRKFTRKINVDSQILSGSDWIVRNVDVKENKVAKENINNIAAKYKWAVEAKNSALNLLENNVELYEFQYNATLENSAGKIIKLGSSEVKPKEDKIPEFIKTTSEKTAKELESKYCQYQDSTNGKYYVALNKDGSLENENTDYACIAVARYRSIIDKYPNSQEAKLAIKDLADIYDNNLIKFDACEIVNGKIKAEAECNTYEYDMEKLANYYYLKSGLKDKVKNRIKGINWNGYIEELGISLKLNSAEKISVKEQGKVSLRIYDNGNSFSEKEITIGDTIEEINSNNKLNVKYIDGKNYVWRLENINPESITLRMFDDKNNKRGPDFITLKLKERTPLPTEYEKETSQIGIKQGIQNSVDVEVREITSSREAYITVIPGGNRAFTTSQFTINIPVDPRPFKWTPQQLKSQIKTTEELIKKLDSVVNKLDKLVSTWKKACLGVFALLTLKSSLLEGTVRAQARRVVTPVFKERCQFEVNQKGSTQRPDFDTVDECLNYYGNDIKKSVDEVESGYTEANKNLEGDISKIKDELEDPGKRCGEFGKYKEAASINGLDNAAMLKNYRDCYAYSAALENLKNDKILTKSLEGNIKGVETLKFIENTKAAENFAKKTKDYDKLSEDQKKELISLSLSQLQENNEIEKDAVNKVIITKSADKKEDYSIIKAVAVLPKTDLSKIKPGEDTIQTLNLVGINQYAFEINNLGSENKLKEKICKEKYGGNINGADCVNANNKYNLTSDIEILKKSTKTDNSGQQLYINEEFYDSNKNQLYAVGVKDESECINKKGIYDKTNNNCKPDFIKSSINLDQAGRSINSEYSYSTDNLEAIYDNDGLALCYPVGNGNYVKVLERYKTGAKAIQYIRLLNVGNNGKIDCFGGNDPVIKHESEIELPDNIKEKRDLLNKEPGKCTRDGDVVGRSAGKSILCKKQTADQLSSLVQPKCIDVMEPDDCKLLFNFCDPVMCPSSRCTLGGRVPPRNVIQSGIIGSTVLCFPNINEGIAVPVCLTGIDAGLKNIRSLLQGYRDCLDIKLNQGQDVGFCDYIRSVGICEMVWREASGLLSISGGIIDWTAAKFGDPQGGGEYLKFQSSLKNVEDSVRVFTNEYKDTYTAQFLGQSSDEIGTQICRLSVNGKIPSFGKILDQLTEPENPPQFTAFFDEAPYAGPGEIAGQTPNAPYGTNELSLYKVFYHIYAGTGYYGGSSAPQSLAGGTPVGIQQPAIYQVYLTNRELGLPSLYVTFRDDEPGGFQASINPGAYAQKSVQKVGPKGYKQVCVMINGQESCGFGKVSSSFGLNELTDVITSKQIQREINSSRECVADDASTPGVSAARLGALGAASIAGGAGVAGSASAQGGTNFGAQALGTITQGTSPVIGLVTSGLDRSFLSNGIVRVCGISEPTNEPERWEKVGSCGSENGNSLGQCWLDRNSVRIQDTNIKNQAYLDLLKARGDLDVSQFIDPDTSKSALIALEGRKNEIIDSIRDLVEKAKKERTSGSTITNQKVKTKIKELSLEDLELIYINKFGQEKLDQLKEKVIASQTGDLTIEQNDRMLIEELRKSLNVESNTNNLGTLVISKSSSANSFNIRENAGTNFKIVGSIPAPAAGKTIEFEILGEEQNQNDGKIWYEIEYNGIQGWIREGPSIKKK